VLKKDHPEFDEMKEKAIDILTLGIEEIRKLSREMVMHDFGHHGLVGSIHNLVDEINYSKTIKIQFVHTEASHIESLDPNIKISIFRIVQEQLKNILKHSKARTAWICLHRCEDQFHLQIRDDGIGFDPDNTPSGLGFSNIYQRTDLYHGKVILNANPGGGCALIISIPLTPPILS
jgi:two-component system sensor histidine kinase UhpB